MPRADLELLEAAERDRAGVSLDAVSFYCLPFLLAPPSRLSLLMVDAAASNLSPDMVGLIPSLLS